MEIPRDIFTSERTIVYVMQLVVGCLWRTMEPQRSALAGIQFQTTCRISSIQQTKWLWTGHQVFAVDFIATSGTDSIYRLVLSFD